MRRTFVVFAILCFATACSPESTEPVEHCKSARIVVLRDISRSILDTHTPKPVLADIEPLFQVLQECGGELAVGVIGDLDYEKVYRLNNRSLERLQIPPRPKPPVGNALEALAEKEQYEAQLNQWRHSTEIATREFKDIVAEIFAIPPEATKTRVAEAVARASLFFTEPGAKADRQILIALTDGDDSEKRTPELPEGVLTIVVNGDGRTGVLEVFQPLRFESLSAAARYLAQDLKR